MVRKIVRYSILFVVLVFLYAPIVLLAIYSFNASTVMGNWSKTWTFDLYRQLFTDQELLTIVGNTLLLAILSAILSTILGTMGAIGIFYSKKKMLPRIPWAVSTLNCYRPHCQDLTKES